MSVIVPDETYRFINTRMKLIKDSPLYKKQREKYRTIE